MKLTYSKVVSAALFIAYLVTHRPECIMAAIWLELWNGGKQ